jgi:hypothetical protein
MQPQHQHYADLAFASYAEYDRAREFYKQHSYTAIPFHSCESDRDEGYLLLHQGRLTIVIRGSDDAQDWCQSNLRFWRNWRDEHSGFAQAASQIFHRIFPAIGIFFEANPNARGYPITIVGHSRGGAIGLHLAKQLSDRGIPVELFSFGAPRAANSDWVKSANFPHTRIAHCDDLVPHLPPRRLGYADHGELVAIGSANCHYVNYRNIRKFIKSGRWLAGHFAYSEVLLPAKTTNLVSSDVSTGAIPIFTQ